MRNLAKNIFPVVVLAIALFLLFVALTRAQAQAQSVVASHDIPVGEAYIIRGYAKCYSFERPTRVSRIVDETHPIDFVTTQIE